MRPALSRPDETACANPLCNRHRPLVLTGASPSPMRTGDPAGRAINRYKYRRAAGGGPSSSAGSWPGSSTSTPASSASSTSSPRARPTSGRTAAPSTTPGQGAGPGRPSEVSPGSGVAVRHHGRASHREDRGRRRRWWATTYRGAPATSPRARLRHALKEPRRPRTLAREARARLRRRVHRRPDAERGRPGTPARWR